MSALLYFSIVIWGGLESPVSIDTSLAFFSFEPSLVKRSPFPDIVAEAFSEFEMVIWDSVKEAVTDEPDLTDESEVILSSFLSSKMESCLRFYLWFIVTILFTYGESGRWLNWLDSAFYDASIVFFFFLCVADFLYSSYGCSELFTLRIEKRFPWLGVRNFRLWGWGGLSLSFIDISSPSIVCSWHDSTSMIVSL